MRVFDGDPNNDEIARFENWRSGTDFSAGTRFFELNVSYENGIAISPVGQDAIYVTLLFRSANP